MHSLTWHGIIAVVVLLFAPSTPTAQTATISRDILSSSTTISTCPRRSVNYITQTLSQQCFTTSWASKSYSPEKATESEKAISDSPKESDLGTHHAVTATHVQETKVQVQSNFPSPSNVNNSTVEHLSEGIQSTPVAGKVTGQGVTQPEVDQQTEADSPLDNANFLSFEEWKRQNLAKAGQSAENLGTRSGGDEPRRRPVGISNALDSLGEDTEIEIDFRGFVNPSASSPSGSPTTNGAFSDEPTTTGHDKGGETAQELGGVRRKSKDAGKTCKERSNYASFDCAATMLKTNAESKGSNAVLVENRDSYMLNICAAKNKFFIVELCDDILIDTVVLANFEFFSSMFRTFRISVSDRFPVKPEKWKDLGTFEAKNSREVQAFLVENPLIWARYLRLEFLTHFGNEYYCPISLLRVHGTTMMEEFNHDLKRTGTEDDGDNELEEGEEDASVSPDIETIGVEAPIEYEQENSDQIVEAAKQTTKPPGASVVDVQSDTNIQSPGAAVDLNLRPESSHEITSYNSSLSSQIERLLSIVQNPNELCKSEDKPLCFTLRASEPTESNKLPTTTRVVDVTKTIDSQSDNDMKKTVTASVIRSTQASPPVPPVNSQKNPPSDRSDTARSYDQASTIVVGKTQTSSSQPPSATPTTQESFFKSVHKRLQLLESNSTLSLQYIEEQSRILRDAFSKVEKRQLAKTTTFLETLNTTVLTELRDFRNQYDQIWQSTVLELSSQREQSQHEVLALSTRIGLLADEIVFQKRMVILQFVLILLCLGLVIFSRSSPSATYLELPPRVQNAINKSSISLSRYTPQFETPPASPSSTRPSSGYGFLRGLTHRRGPSDESQIDGVRSRDKSPSIAYSPPTPTSQGSPEVQRDRMAGDHSEEESSDGFPLAEIDAVRQTKSSPATPGGS